MKDEAIAKFTESLRGPVIGCDHPEYEEARRLYNAMIDKRPRLIARCVDAADVIAAVNFGRDNGLTIAVRGGAHNGAGLGSVNDGLVVDLSLMKGCESTRRSARRGSAVAASPAMSITPPAPSGRPCRSGSSRRPVLPG